MASLKEAMNFVIGSLGPRDRLAIVYFNSQGGALHNLLKMTPENKQRSRTAMAGLRAGGGTDILNGMELGWSVLERRQTQNQSSCVFLLTDGQDPSKLEAKKTLARQIKQSGSSLFVFGFGADHDSAHMNAIATAAEGPFTYVETNDTVIDAFGGAIGTQQGAALKNITFTIRAASEGVEIASAVSGAYSVTASADRRTTTVSFANLYVGEFRDVLVKVNLPAVAAVRAATAATSPEEEGLEARTVPMGGEGDAVDYPVLSAVASFTPQGVAQGVEGLEIVDTSEEVVGSVLRLPAERLTVEGTRKDLSVDAQVVRDLGVRAIASALQSADAANFGSSQAILDAAIAMVRGSPSFVAGDAASLAMAQDLTEALSKVRSRTEYASGGRALMAECHSATSRQRSCYTKAGKASHYQSTMSSVRQQNWASCKSTSLRVSGGGGGGGVDRRKVVLLQQALGIDEETALVVFAQLPPAAEVDHAIEFYMENQDLF